VVEGSTAVYGDSGEVFIIYSGSGYWTKYYQLGQLKYKGGNPLEKIHWDKKSTSIFSLSETVNGCGHASYVTDTAGKRWVCYHAYIGPDTSSGRYVFLEPYEVNSSGVTIGNGSGHPAGLDVEQQAALNPIPVRQKIAGFHTVE
jgi:hypothetical protein